MTVSRKVSLAAGALAALWVAVVVFAARPAAQEQPRMRESIVGKKAGAYFKNVTTSTLKELTVDDFIGAMGVMTDAMGLDCADCHPNAGSDQVDWVFDTARKKTARRMVEMVANLNKQFFGGAQRVTCWTCHHGRVIPATSIALNAVYEAPNSELDDFVPRDPDQPAATEILDKFIAAVGGAQRWGAVRNYVATGASIGFGGFGGDGQFEIFAAAPAQRTVRIQFPQHRDRGISMWVYNGTNGWVNTPRALLENYDLIGGELDGAALEAKIAFWGNIKNSMTNWRTGFRRVIGDQEYFTVQGNGPRGQLGTFYIDPKTYLLKRLVRLNPSPVGNVGVQIDYDDWKDAGQGVKLPFEYNFYWLDGKYTAKVKDYKFNTTIDPTIFQRPKDQ